MGAIQAAATGISKALAAPGESSTACHSPQLGEPASGLPPHPTPGLRKGRLLGAEGIEKGAAVIAEGLAHQLQHAGDGGGAGGIRWTSGALAGAESTTNQRSSSSDPNHPNDLLALKNGCQAGTAHADSHQNPCNQPKVGAEKI